MFVLVRILHQSVGFVKIIFVFFCLFFIFNQEPDVCLCSIKETGYFILRHPYEKFFYIFLKINIDIFDFISYTVAKQSDKPMSRSK
ncbi:hypothetical protein CLOSTHATH_02910 [Hungatella hathewayi DSM 13479]|uniref:Uncharacterized protein n=1 Tax=Hungatella hathewayi DSM 13479 TaxID=566550 RepID=D3AH23_9FIRM|nr:hypothetical protein CLOSTHATH_02910 [Hungatella hathewayi DSM 13479]